MKGAPEGSFRLLGNRVLRRWGRFERAWRSLSRSCCVLLVVPAFARRRVQKGDAVYYANKYAGGATACGGTYDPSAKTAAHRKLPCGSIVRVKNLANGEKVKVTITDRGPYGDKDTIIDVSRKAAKRLGFWEAGRTEVRLVVLDWGD